MPRKTDGIEFEIHPRPTKGEDGKPLLYVRPAKGRKKSFKDLEAFCNKYRNLRTGELQMVMDEALRRSMRLGYTTIPDFMIYSGLRRDSAKAYLDSLCQGEHPRLWKVRESRRWLYFPKKDETKE